MSIFTKLLGNSSQSEADQAASADMAIQSSVDVLSCECCGATVLNGSGLCNYCSNRYNRLEQKPVWRTTNTKDKGYLYR